ncbi:MAG: hypothetical protein ACD_79C00338G0002 [uncultured bacterium]|nr:MAG: hypothetical protein ACD_79C00338G0002 [uncultured bacterium]
MKLILKIFFLSFCIDTFCLSENQSIILKVDYNNLKDIDHQKTGSFLVASKTIKHLMTANISIKNTQDKTDDFILEWYFFSRRINGEKDFKIINYGKEEITLKNYEEKEILKKASEVSFTNTAEKKGKSIPYAKITKFGFKAYGYIVLVKNNADEILKQNIHPKILEKFVKEPDKLKALLDEKMIKS